MTAMARHRQITGHPAFTPLIALWFAALLGLTLAVLPSAVLERWLAAVGLATAAPLTSGARMVAAGLAAVIGAAAGYALARRFARGAGGDPRPVYAEAGAPFDESVEQAPVRRRPLRVRDELAGGFGDESQVVAVPPAEPEPSPVRQPIGETLAEAEDGLMILTPQPIHPPHPAPDLEALLDKFDAAFAAFCEGEGEGAGAPASERRSADPVQAFVAQQTGVPAPSSHPSPIGGLVPDHQAELRAALDKLARSQRKD